MANSENKERIQSHQLARELTDEEMAAAGGGAACDSTYTWGKFGGGPDVDYECSWR